MYYPCSKNKGADQLRGYREADFAYADCWFSHEAAHIAKGYQMIVHKSSPKTTSSGDEILGLVFITMALISYVVYEKDLYHT